MRGPDRPDGDVALIDRFLPLWDVGEHHRMAVDAEPGRAYRAVREADLARSGVIRVLFALRGLPGRGPVRLENLTGVGFTVLGEEPGTELVLGIVGRFWRLRGGLVRVPATEFVAFSEPGYAKAAWDFRVRPLPDGRSTVSTETRVRATDPAARRAFRRYWVVVGPGSALVRRRALAVIRAEAERGAG